jgi:lipoprotein NlpI
MNKAQNLFFEGKIAECLAAFDVVIEARPEILPHLWQRGIALYYADAFQEGREQFEQHQHVNSRDVENAAWHFLCVARLEGVDSARKHFIPIQGDGRIPMAQVHRMFAGIGSVEDVLDAANVGADDERLNRLCYGHLYVGLYYEAMGDEELAKVHILKAANEFAQDHYMGITARVHAQVRGWDK